MTFFYRKTIFPFLYDCISPLFFVTKCWLSCCRCGEAAVSRGTCASIWDLVWIPLFVVLAGMFECCRNVLGEALLIRLRKASLGEESLFWLECSRLSFNSEASLNELRKASQKGRNVMRCFWSVPRLFVEHFVLVFVKIKQILILKCVFRFVLRPFLKINRILFR